MYKLIALTLFALICTFTVIAREDIVDLTCLTAVECRQFQHNSSMTVRCVRAVCQCSDENDKRIKCQPKPELVNNIIGGHCPCTMRNSECNNNEDVCYCATNFMPSKDRRRCLQKVAALRDDCELDIQCTASDHFSECNTGRRECQCQKGFVSLVGICATALNASVSCNQDDDCDQFGPEAMCATEERTCACQNGYVKAPKKDICMKGSYYHGYCDYNIQCQLSMGPGAICVQQECVCNSKDYLVLKREFDEYVADEMRWQCAPYRTLGEYCRYDEDCHHDELKKTIEPSMRCALSECNCRKGWTSHNKKNCTVNDANHQYYRNNSIPMTLIVFTVSSILRHT